MTGVPKAESERLMSFAQAMVERIQIEQALLAIVFKSVLLSGQVLYLTHSLHRCLIHTQTLLLWADTLHMLEGQHLQLQLYIAELQVFTEPRQPLTPETLSKYVAILHCR